MAYPQSLSGLTTREQIADTVVRACLGLDNNDKALWQSAWSSSPDITLTISGRVMKGIDELNKDCFDGIGPMDTQHLLSSIRIDVKEGADVAHLTANALAQHFRPGQGQVPGAERMLAGSTYDCRIVKEADGQWRLMAWALKIVWTEGTWAVMQSA